MKREYSNDKITVLWDSDKCIHARECVDRLPRVFNVKKRPWVNLDAADAEEIKRVIDYCPTGALSYQEPDQLKSEPFTIKVIKDGPYKVSGNCRLIGADGEELEPGNVFALCRCGASKKMPFCDGSHRDVGFKDDKRGEASG